MEIIKIDEEKRRAAYTRPSRDRKHRVCVCMWHAAREEKEKGRSTCVERQADIEANGVRERVLSLGV